MFLIPSPRADAQNITLVSSLNEPSTAVMTTGGPANGRRAQKFTVPASQDYILVDVTIVVAARGDDGLALSIHNGSAADPPNTVLYALSGPTSGTGETVYSAPAGTILQGGNDYFVMLKRRHNRSDGTTIRGTTGNGQSGQTGWSIANTHRTESIGAAWTDDTNVLSMRLRGRVYTPSKPSLSIADASTAENAGHLLFGVTLSRAARRTVKVDFETIAGGTATAGEDYHARRTYTHVILPGNRTAQMGFALIEDAVDDPGETVKARLSNARVVDAYGKKVRDLDITRAEATGTITAPPSTSDVQNLSLRINDATGDEGDSFFRFNVTLSRKYTEYVCYDFETISGGTATEGMDYEKRPKVGHWVDIGERTDDPFVYIIDDRVNDDSETIMVEISNARICGDASQTVSITRAQATGTIRNTDPVNGDQAVTPVPALPLAGVGLLGLLLALLGSRRKLNDRRQLDTARGR